MNHRSVGAFVVVVVAGLVAPYLLAAASALVAGFIEPGARVIAFLSGHPRHPLQLALAVSLLHLVAGFGVGSMLALVGTRAHFTRPWLLWLLFVGSLCLSMVVMAASSGWTSGYMLALRLLPFVLASGAALQLVPWLRHPHAR